MSNLLAVPIHLDALYLSVGKPVAEARADFTRLPYFDGSQDVNSSIPFLSESIISKPFQPLNLYLKPGVHLHWSLPDALTHGVQNEEGMRFPDVPNRWLISRSRTNAGDRPVVEKRWVVESDYLYPDGKGYESGAITFPVAPNILEGKHTPFRHMGRKLTLSAWLNEQSSPSTNAEYLDHLNAVGYGEPTFAAFYPNCHSVFGFHDGEVHGEQLEGIRYDVIGWYARPDQDYLKNIIGQLSDKQSLGSILESEAKWVVNDNQITSDNTPSQLICYSRLTFGKAEPKNREDGLTIAIGNSGTEALSAYLAHTISPAHKDVLEDRLEAVALMPHIEEHQLDLDLKFLEARHESGFVASSAGTLWTIRRETKTGELADAENSQTDSEIKLPDGIGEQLNRCNLIQHELDRATEDIESLRHQLFADWYKYMLCLYPPEDSLDRYPAAEEVKHFIERKELPALGEKLRAKEQIKTRLIEQLTVLHNQLNSLNQQFLKKSEFRLKSTAGPRYWLPAEPVILIAGERAEPTKRHGQDGRNHDQDHLICNLLIDHPLPTDLESIDQLWNRVDQLLQAKSAVGHDTVGYTLQTDHPWHPILLEWEVGFYTAAADSNRSSEGQAYRSQFVKTNFDFGNDSVDFQSNPDHIRVASSGDFYTGVSILTPTAKIDLKKRIEAYFIKYLMQHPDHLLAFFDDDEQALEAATQSTDYLKENLNSLINWYLSDQCDGNGDQAICQILQTYIEFTQNDHHILTQSLSGFNDALLMFKQSMQLPIEDPLGFDEYQAFASDMRRAIHKSNRIAPLPLNDFSPIRAGALEIKSLRLLDTFGQAHTVEWDQVIIAETMRNPTNENWPLLKPRLAQPARINLRWLSALHSIEEMNDHPATSPICGWLLPNHLDNSLMIYDADGVALGSIDYLANWEPAPGSYEPITAEKLFAPNSANQPPFNQHLHKVVTRLCNNPNDLSKSEAKVAYLTAFVQTLENALEHIDPENYAHHQSQALLMGRPIAVVRAALNLELAGPPAVDQGWPAFIQDLKRNTRDTNRFTEVDFGIRIGEHGQLNDGVVGFWVESQNGDVEDVLYAPQTDQISHDAIRTHADEAVVLTQSLVQDPYFLTMLMDPRGKVHATTGILPTKVIDIPPDQYTAALQAIEITFLSTPIITPKGEINIATPTEPGYAWSWLSKTKSSLEDEGRWAEVSAQPTIEKDLFLANYPSAEAVWEYLIQPEVRWLKTENPSDLTAEVVPPSGRKQSRLQGDFLGLDSKINQLMNIHIDNDGSVSMTSPSIPKEHLSAGLPAGGEVWDHLLDPAVGWLTAIPNQAERANVAPKDLRPNHAMPNAPQAEATQPAQLTGRFAHLDDKINALFDLFSTGIRPLHQQARFTGRQEIREGWLKLRRLPEETGL